MDEQAKQVLKRIASLAPASAENSDDRQWLAEFRNGVANLRSFGAPPEPVQSVTNIFAGNTQVRLYRPAPGKLPLLLFASTETSAEAAGHVEGALRAADRALELAVAAARGARGS